MSSVELHRARTLVTDPQQAAERLLEQLPSSAKPKLVTVFASRSLDQLALNRALRERLPKGTRIVGTTSGAELDNEGIHERSIVLGALSGDFDVGLGVGRDLSQDAIVSGNVAINSACDELGILPNNLGSRHVGMVIDDAFRYKKEEFLLGMLEPNPALVLVGGGASDTELDPAKQSSQLHIDGEVVTDAVVCALFKSDVRWAAMRSHWYVPTGRTLRITRVDETCTRALEIDGKPAAKRYAELLGVTVSDLEFGKPHGFATQPTALRVGREYFVRAPWKPLDDGSILYANLIEEGTELEIMQLGDIVRATNHFFREELPHRVGNPTALILFQCSGRQWFADAVGKRAELAQTFTTAPPSVGFNCHFEIYCGFHINTTLTVLAFGSGTST
ncbi:FIST C-terminal domain-containing protein [Pendulispora rubella]|uniref:FIST C-terminal domain-containing protein n=1 Tax=Pendulispora rubella TaxID=2741070 RepID=A0ABZ2KTC8_9BACT